MATLEKALQIAAKAHAGVKDKQGRDNTSLNRVLLRQDRYEADSTRLQKYVLSYRFLTDQINLSDYRSLMTRVE